MSKYGEVLVKARSAEVRLHLTGIFRKAGYGIWSVSFCYVESCRVIFAVTEGNLNFCRFYTSDPRAELSNACSTSFLTSAVLSPVLCECNWI